MKLCASCSGSMTGKRPHAVYCSRKCKSVASEKRRTRDDAARYQRERDRRIAYAKAYAQQKPWIGQAIRMRRKQRIRNAGSFTFTGEAWRRMCERHNWRCFYCGEHTALTMDHIIPISRGGRHSEGNIVPACLTCNCTKRARLIVEWRRSNAAA